MNKKNAFTLIELVVTISLIGILFVISMPIFTEFQNSSRLKSSAQIVETTFGEAFSSARSRPECFVVSGKENNLTLTSFDKTCQAKKFSRDFQLNPGVTFKEDFKVKFKPPFGDIDISKEEEEGVLEIEMCNKDCVTFQLNKKSGLFSRVSNQVEDEQ